MGTLFDLGFSYLLAMWSILHAILGLFGIYAKEGGPKEWDAQAAEGQGLANALLAVLTPHNNTNLVN